MGVFSENAIIGASAAGGYDIDYSCRFNADDSYLSKTFSSASNRKTWTYSAWVKKTRTDKPIYLLSSDFADTSNILYIDIRAAHATASKDCTGEVLWRLGSTTSYRIATTQVFKDPSAWYHFVIACDTTQATDTDRMKFYVNGELVTSFSVDERSTITQNADLAINRAAGHDIASWNAGEKGGGYLADVNFIDGLALTPASFGETDEDTGQWKAIKYAGSYGTNGFFLEFKSSGALGSDTSGNGNDWTVTNLVATDQMLDSPQNSTGGNFSTLNPLYYSSTAYDIQEGNLKFVNSSASWWKVLSTFGMTSGKWYAEVRFADNGAGPLATFGAVSNFTPDTIPNMHNQYVGQKTYEQGYHKNGYTETGGSNPGTGTYASYAAGDKMGCAIDVDNLKIYWAKNGTWQNSGDPTSGSTGTGARDLSNNTATNGLWFFGFTGHEMNPTVNFGQDSSFAGTETAQGNSDGNGNGDFYYTPPAGYLALCSNNLEDPSIALPGENFNTVLYTGTGTAIGSGGQAITGVGFQSDFTWIKKRDATARSHVSFDVIRGGTNALFPDTNAQQEMDVERLNSWQSDGFTVGNEVTVGVNTKTYVSWNWKADGTGVSNTEGSLDATVSANTEAGFSIVRMDEDGTGGTATVGHGLSKAPELVIGKPIASTDHWRVGSDFLASWVNILRLDTEDAEASFANCWASTAPTSTLVTMGSDGLNNTGYRSVLYCFHSVEGYSKVGKYTGNANANGAFVYTGFRPAFLIAKNLAAGKPWVMYDDKRDTYNEMYKQMVINNVVENTSEGRLDFVSNGIKWRIGDSYHNDGNFIYIAFAESPFKTARAR